MKNQLLIFISSLIFLASCCTKEETKSYYTHTNALIPQEVEIKYEHNLIIPNESDIFKTIDLPSFTEKIVNTSINSKTIPVFDAMEGKSKLSTEEINEILGEKIEYDLKINNNDTTKIAIKNTFNKEELQRILFIESWEFDNSNFVMTKHIKKYSPIKVFYRESDTLKKDMLKQLLCWYDYENTESKPQKNLTLLAKDVSYEFNLYNNNTPNWIESFSPSRFVNILLDNVLSGKQPAYDFFSSEKDKKLNIEEIKQNLGETVENYFIENPNTGEYDTVQVIGKFYPDEIMSVIFIEDWYIDDSNLKIYKYVKKIAPVRQYISFNEKGDEEYEKKIPFYVILNQ